MCVLSLCVLHLQTHGHTTTRARRATCQSVAKCIACAYTSERGEGTAHHASVSEPVDHNRTPTHRVGDMAHAQREAIQRIREYSNDARELQDDSVDFDASSTEARLAQTVKELQVRVQEQQAALDQVRHRNMIARDFAKTTTAEVSI